jgi:hypothetical protein
MEAEEQMRLFVHTSFRQNMSIRDPCEERLWKFPEGLINQTMKAYSSILAYSTDEKGRGPGLNRLIGYITYPDFNDTEVIMGLGRIVSLGASSVIADVYFRLLAKKLYNSSEELGITVNRTQEILFYDTYTLGLHGEKRWYLIPIAILWLWVVITLFLVIRTGASLNIVTLPYLIGLASGSPALSHLAEDSKLRIEKTHDDNLVLISERV